MKLLITGSRTLSNYARVKHELDQLSGVELVLHGGARGADMLAQRWADENKIPTEVIRPDYEKYEGHYAPLVRNKELVNRCSHCVAFYDGVKTSGTAYTAQLAAKANKLLQEVIIRPSQLTLL